MKIEDPHVVTSLPLPDTSRADVEITVPLENLSSSPIEGKLEASFGDISVAKANHAASRQDFRKTGSLRIPSADRPASEVMVAERLW